MVSCVFFQNASPGFPPIQKQFNNALPSYSQHDSRLIILWTIKVYGSSLTIFSAIYGSVYDQPGTINLYGPEYGQPGAIKRKLGKCSQLTHTLMKLQNIPQPKVQYNQQIENKVAIINFWQLLLNYW